MPPIERELVARERQQTMGMALVGGLLGVSFVGALQLLSLDALNAALLASLIAFAVSTAFLGIRFWAYAIDDYNDLRGGWFDALEVVGFLASIIGVALVFWAASITAGVVFLGAAGLALWMASRGLSQGRKHR